MMAQEEGELPSYPPREKREMDEEFQFLRCEECQSEAENPKLLPCLHNLCTKCLQETKRTGLCVTCQAPHPRNAELPEFQDNLLFSKLQATLSIYQKIMEGNDLTCDCEKEGQLWCADCASFLCNSCFESHQKFLKGENHEARLLRDIQAETSQEFLLWNRKQSVLFCPKKGHTKKILSIYCKECQQFLCCTCAVLDFGHVGKQCDIREEIQKRQEELQSMSVELKEKKQSFENTQTDLKEQRKEMEDVNQKTKEQICQKVEEMVQVLREKERTFLQEIEEQYKQQVQDVEMKLQDLEGVLKRMDSGVKLVEKMDRYASEQQFLEMYHFIQGSLENLKQKQPPAVDSQIQAGNSVEVKKRLQALFERVTKDKEDASLTLEMTPGQGHFVKGPAKRTYVEDKRATPTPTKVIKSEWEASDGMEEPVSPASCSLLGQPGTISESVGRGGRTPRSADNTGGSTISYQRRDSSSTEISDTGLLQLGGPAAALDGPEGLATEEWHTLRVQPPCQVRQSPLTKVLPSMSSSPALDLSLAGFCELGQSSRQLDIGQEELYFCGEPYTEPSPLPVERYNAEDIHPDLSSARLMPESGQNIGSSEDRSDRTTVNIMEEEEEQGEHDLPPAGDLRFQEQPSEAEGHQEVEGWYCCGPTLFSHAQNSHLSARLSQCMSPLWAPVDRGWLDGFQSWQDAFVEVLRILNGHLSTSTAQMQNMKDAIAKQHNSMAEEIRKVQGTLASLMGLGRNMQDEITQTSLLVQELICLDDIAPGRYGNGRGQRVGQRGGRGRQRGGRRRGALQ